MNVQLQVKNLIKVLWRYENYEIYNKIVKYKGKDKDK